MRLAHAASALAVLAALTLTGCDISPGPVEDGGHAPTGIAPGVTLYFADDAGTLEPQQRETGRLGTIAEALALLLTGPGDTELRTGLPLDTGTRVGVTLEEGAIQLTLPLAFDEVSPLGIDQLVCTALGVLVQSGGDPGTAVRLSFTIAPPGADEERTCPVIG